MSLVFTFLVKEFLPLTGTVINKCVFCTRLVRDDFKGQLGAFTPCFTDIVILGEFCSHSVALARHTHIAGPERPLCMQSVSAEQLSQRKWAEVTTAAFSAF